MTFAHRIKQEILSNKMSKKQAAALISGICYSIGRIENNMVFLKINNQVISSGIIEILKKLNFEIVNNNSSSAKIYFKFDDRISFDIPKIYLSQFVGGLFLGGGSISKVTTSSYHLEIKIINRSKMQKLLEFLNLHKFNFHYIDRESHTIIYIKKSDTISDFLRAMGSYGGVMEFEDHRITRDFNNNINRIANLEVHNQYKIAQSSIKHTKLFLELKSNLKYKKLDIKYKRLISLRLANKFVSLADLAELYYKKYGIKTNKSTLNNWINQLKKI